MSNFSERNPVPIAIIGLSGLMVVLLMALNFQRLPFVVGGTTYRAAFTDASGLAVGEEVRIAGLKVGAVRDIYIERDHIVVEFTVEDVKLGDQTQAGIELKSLLGQHYLSVTPAGSGELKANAEIPVSRTSTPLNIVPAFNQLSEQTAAIDNEQVAAAFDSLAATLNRTAPEMQGALTGLSRLSRSVTTRDAEIRQLFSRANQVSGVVAARDRELGQLLTASDQVVATLVERRATIRRLITGTSQVSRQVIGLVQDNEKTLRPALSKLNTVLDVLRKHEKELDEMLTYAAPYAREFTNVGGSGRWFDSSIKLPQGAALCSTNDSTSISSELLDSVLSEINNAVNGTKTPCLPLGPAVGSRLGGDQ